MRIKEPFHKLLFFLRYEFNKKKPFYFQYFGYKVYYEKEDGGVNHISRGYEYEKDLIQTAKKYLNNSSIVFDIGANIGLVTLALYKNYKNAQFFCFEPSPYPFKYFKKTLIANNVNEKIKVYKTGLYNRNGKVSFFIHKHKDALGDGIKDTGRAGPSQKYLINTITLDSFVKKNQLKKIDLIKIDVEGAELAVLEGGVKTLNNYRPVILIEANPKNMAAYKILPEDLFNFLQKNKYQLYNLRSKKLNKNEFTKSAFKNDNYLSIPYE